MQFTDDGEDARATRVRQLVEHARLAVQVARLGVELTRRLDELDLSRSRIAESADDERRRIQRDLHDGAQQRLVTVGIALRRLESRLRVAGRAPDADLIDGAVDDLATTIQELRNLTDALPPPQLDGGIGPALRELASRSPIPVVVDAGSERVGRTVETAAYFVACEGLTNVIKHAAASGATIRAMRHHGSLFVSVSDDGVGGATVRPGSGLAGLSRSCRRRRRESPDRLRPPRHTADCGAAVRLMLVEDQALLREGLIGVFRDAGHEVVWSAGSCVGLDEAFVSLTPRCRHPRRPAAAHVHRRRRPGGRRAQGTPPRHRSGAVVPAHRDCAQHESGRVGRLRVSAQGPGPRCP